MVAEWDIKGKGSRCHIDEKWSGKIITKVLINVRFRLIDSKAPKSPKVTTEQWNALVAIRATEMSKRKSELMRSISKRKASKAAQMHGLREAALVKLVGFLSTYAFSGFGCFCRHEISTSECVQ